jgi:hypothetical protein
MDGYQFIATLFQSVASLAWPVAALSAVYVFRKELRGLLPQLRVKHKDWEASFSRLDQAEREAARLPEAAEQPPPTPEETSKFEQIAEVSPRAAILELRAELEEAVKSFAEAVGMLKGGAPRGLLALTRELRKNELIDSATSALLDDLRVIGNTAAHNADSTITKEDAIRFRNLAERIVGQFSIATGAAIMNRRPAPIPPRME